MRTSTVTRDTTGPAPTRGPRLRVDIVDTYLGYDIRCVGGWYVAGPRGWHGEVLGARSKPLLRRKIWRWWYQVQP